jgi:hypothetical protein
MNYSQLIVLTAVIVVLAGLVYLLWARRRQGLRNRFGPEYTRTVRESGGTLRAERQLANLEKRVDRYNIRPLSVADRTRFLESWRHIQATFVDHPQMAVAEADRLVGEAMAARGYPVVDFNQQAADLSVNHALVVEHYRAGHEIALRHTQGRATTEDLRQAMIHYRQLFEDLVGEHESTRPYAVLG